MEQLLTQQKKNIEELNNAIRNFGKDSIDRKTKIYYEKRIVKLATWLKTFKEIHAALEEYDCSNQLYKKKKICDL